MKFTVTLICALIGCFVSWAFAADGDTTKLAHVIKLKDGKVQGIVEEASNGHKVDTYIGIRYGHAKRFEKATPVKAWDDIYNATHWRDACPQPGVGVAPNKMPFHTETISEDCLFLTVTRPHNSHSTNRSVMFWIHGGGYNSGSIFTMAYDGRYLASQGDVIVVIVQYRLGPFGFLAEESTKEIHPGNLGLYDALLGLKWVHENIAHFGGNVYDVTIFGESAGSFAVGSLLLSPLAKGLFHRAIMQSGAPNSYFGVQSYKQNSEVTKWMGSRVHCNNDTAAHLVDCLKEKTVQELVDGYQKLTAQDQNFKPVYGEPLLPIRPVEALKSGKFNQDVDLMFGTTSHEGSGFVLWLSPEIRSNQTLTMTSAKEAIKEQMKFFHAGYETEIAQYYTGKLPANATQDQLKLAIADSFGDYHLVCPTILYAEEVAKTVHLTHPKRKFFAYRLVKPTGQMNCTGWQPVCHAEDLFPIFIIPAISSNAELMKLSHDMIHAWTHFAKHGQPGKMGDVHWTEAFERTQTVSTTYMSLDPAAYQMVPKFYQQTCDAFWKPKIFV